MKELNRTPELEEGETDKSKAASSGLGVGVGWRQAGVFGDNSSRVAAVAVLAL